MLIREILVRTSSQKWSCFMRRSFERTLQTGAMTGAQAGASGDPPKDPVVNVEELLENFARDVDESKLSEDALAIHKAHINALRVGWVLLFVL